jgi:type I restriction-modification system DNA methylase subunit
VIVVNPPYIRIQEMPGADLGQLKYFKTYSAAKHNYDIYALFAERCYMLLRSQDGISGRVGLILPNKFFTANYGKGLREFLATRQAVYAIVDFNAEQVFKKVTTYTCLLFLSRSRATAISYYQLLPKQPIEEGLKVSIRHALTVPSSSLSGDKDWHFYQDEVQALKSKLGKLGERLDQVSDRIFQGLKTSADKIYIAEAIHQSTNEIRIYSEQLRTERTVEPDLWRPLIKGGNAKRYFLKPTRLVILFPYIKGANGNMRLITENELRELYPRTYSYLLENKKYLESRERGKMKELTGTAISIRRRWI